MSDQAFVDIHCHILPGLDDGAKTLDDSQAMLLQAAAQGVAVICCSPHWNDVYRSSKSAILEAAGQLQGLSDRLGAGIRILPGEEVHLYGGMPDDVRAGKVFCIGGADADQPSLLVELPHSHVPEYAGQAFFDIAVQGIQPILVHPERNQEIVAHPSLLERFLDQGVQLQLTAASVTGHFGRASQKLSLKLLKAGAVSFIASDAHNVTSRDFRVSEALRIISKKFGQSMADSLVGNAQRLLGLTG